MMDMSEWITEVIMECISLETKHTMQNSSSNKGEEHI